VLEPVRQVLVQPARHPVLDDGHDDLVDRLAEEDLLDGVDGVVPRSETRRMKTPDSASQPVLLLVSVAALTGAAACGGSSGSPSGSATSVSASARPSTTAAAPSRAASTSAAPAKSVAPSRWTATHRVTSRTTSRPGCSRVPVLKSVADGHRHAARRLDDGHRAGGGETPGPPRVTSTPGCLDRRGKPPRFSPQERLALVTFAAG
jgi:hypothetical protein